MKTLLPSQPESYSQLLKRSFRLYKSTFYKTIPLALLLAIVIFIPRLLSDIVGQELFLNLDPFSPYRIWLFVINFAGLLIFIALIWHIHCLIHRIHEPLMEDFSVGIRKIISVIIATLIQTIIIFGISAIFYGSGLLLIQYNLIVPQQVSGMSWLFVLFLAELMLTLYIATLFVLLIPLIAIENKGIISSLERSASLVWNHWWRTFSLQLTPWISYLIVLTIIRFVLNINIHLYFAEQGAHNLFTSLLNIVVFTLFIPWVAAILLIQLKDLELRKSLK